ncbi:hypothetical protein BKA58DRAFT_366862 [Alternaria rosae]|uniref:uncharacterized protein n=1 Tax=Alternaria rosae TaxID=1187941 RepID=UPI001E8EB85F|nr:uncharacterized protein BKA58DRAFT_366862 [Alternaria rosae]KAH6864974.1 hypothetical protein BKA58DRAFT_366862 [Alternaria rosae]
MQFSSEVIIGLVVLILGVILAGLGVLVSCFSPRRGVFGPLARSARYKASRINFFIKHYGLTGIALWCFASREVWQIQLQVIRSTEDGDVTNYKKSAQEDSNIIAVAGTIIAQIAITALSLDKLSKTHWVARAFFTFSLVSAIMAVYYATRQYRTLGRCLRIEQMKTWICGKNRSKNKTPCRTPTTPSEHPDLPSVAAVLTVSAPNMLMSASLNCLLVGFAVYLGFTWTENLDAEAGKDGSRAVFITYIAGLIFCYGVYSISSAVVASDSHVSEHDLLYGNDDANTQQHISRDEESAAGASSQPEISTLVHRSSNDQILGRGQSTQILSGPPQDRDLYSGIFAHDSTRGEELLQLFQEATTLRKARAESDESFAYLFGRLP